MSSRQQGKYRNQRFIQPDEFKKYVGPYQFDGDELQNLAQQGIQRVHTQLLDLTVAQSPLQPLIIEVPGRAFKIKGLTKATQYDIVANAGIESAATSVIVGAWIDKPGFGNMNNTDYHILKSGDGFRGDFLRICLFWPTQANNSARLTIFKFDDTPWISGDTST